MENPEERQTTESDSLLDSVQIIPLKPRIRKGFQESFKSAGRFFNTKSIFHWLFLTMAFFLNFINWIVNPIARSTLDRTLTSEDKENFMGGEVALLRKERGAAAGQAMMSVFASDASLWFTGFYTASLLTSFIAQEVYSMKYNRQKSLMLAVFRCCRNWGKEKDFRTSAYRMSKALALGGCTSISMINFILQGVMRAHANFLGLEQNDFFGNVNYTNSTIIENSDCQFYAASIKAICALEQFGLDERRLVQSILLFFGLIATVLFAIPTRTPERRLNSDSRVGLPGQPGDVEEGVGDNPEDRHDAASSPSSPASSRGRRGRSATGRGGRGGSSSRRGRRRGVLSTASMHEGMIYQSLPARDGHDVAPAPKANRIITTTDTGAQFELLNNTRLGNGNFGVVKQARCVAPGPVLGLTAGQVVAVKKVYHSEKFDEEKQAVAMPDGGATLRGSHNIIHSFGSCEAEGHKNRAGTGKNKLYLFSQFLDGGDGIQLRDSNNLRRVDHQARLERIKPYALDLLEALKMLHDHHMYHLDFKPANFMLQTREDIATFNQDNNEENDREDHRENYAVIIDFGCAQQADDGRITSGKGDWDYFSPQRFGVYRKVGQVFYKIDASKILTTDQDSYGGASEDAWAFGVTLLELYMGYNPFSKAYNLAKYSDTQKARLEASTPEFFTTILHDLESKDPVFMDADKNSLLGVIKGLLTVDAANRLTIDAAIGRLSVGAAVASSSSRPELSHTKSTLNLRGLFSQVVSHSNPEKDEEEPVINDHTLKH